MRSDKTLVLINAAPWLIDFRRNRFTQLPKTIHRAITNLENLFDRFDSDGAFHVWRHAIRYKDYAEAEMILKDDAATNRDKHAHGRQPPLELVDMFKHAEETRLEGATDPVLKACDTLLGHSMSCLSVNTFHNDTVQLRPSPSVGARHGIDVFVQTKSGMHYYSGSRHALLHIGVTPPAKHDIELIFVCRADVYMWRYPQGSCLLDVYFDFGHILGNVAIAATAAGIGHPIIAHSPLDMLNLPPGAMLLGTVAVNKR